MCLNAYEIVFCKESIHKGILKNRVKKGGMKEGKCKRKTSLQMAMPFKGPKKGLHLVFFRNQSGTR